MLANMRVLGIGASDFVSEGVSKLKSAMVDISARGNRVGDAGSGLKYQFSMAILLLCESSKLFESSLPFCDFSSSDCES